MSKGAKSRRSNKPHAAAKTVLKPTRAKVAIIYALYTLAAAITVSGVFFMVYSAILQLSFRVLNVHVPGLVFGLIVAYLGLRYFLLVRKLKKEVYDASARFKWSNLKPRRFFARSK